MLASDLGVRIRPAVLTTIPDGGAVVKRWRHPHPSLSHRFEADHGGMAGAVGANATRDHFEKISSGQGIFLSLSGSLPVSRWDGMGVLAISIFAGFAKNLQSTADPLRSCFSNLRGSTLTELPNQSGQLHGGLNGASDRLFRSKP